MKIYILVTSDEFGRFNNLTHYKTYREAQKQAEHNLEEELLDRNYTKDDVECFEQDAAGWRFYDDKYGWVIWNDIRRIEV